MRVIKLLMSLSESPFSITLTSGPSSTFQCDFTVNVFSQIFCTKVISYAIHLMKENGIYFDKSFHPLLTQNIKHGFETMKCVFYSD